MIGSEGDMWRNRQGIPQRLEQHFGDRVLQCFAERPSSLPAMLAAQFARDPAHEAMVGEEGRLSYEMLEDRILRIAAGFRDLGIAPGDRVAILLGNRFSFIESVLACIASGAIAVPLSTRMAAPEIAYCINDCRAKMLIHPQGREELPAPDETPSLLTRLPDSALAGLRQSLPESWHDAAEEDPAFILYTSGTTGLPKGAMLTGFNVIHSVLHFIYGMELSHYDRSLLAVPGSHVTGLIANIMTIFGVGGTLVVLEEFKARRCLQCAANERITHTIIVPAMYNLMLRDPEFESFDLSAWRVGGYGGAPMPEATIAELARKAPSMGLMNAYGATEVTSPATLLPAELTASRADSVGLPMHCAEILIMDEKGVELPHGETGEIWIRGPMVVPGYWNNDEANAANFIAGFWRSGDIGSMDANGFLRVLDRKKDMINRGGYKIYSAEVENVLSGHPAVLECAVIGFPCEVLGERVRAIIVPSNSAAGDSVREEITAYATAQMADYKVPEDIVFYTAPLPRNANGKVLKTALR